jgi:hypothetical protein
MIRTSTQRMDSYEFQINPRIIPRKPEGTRINKNVFNYPAMSRYFVSLVLIMKSMFKAKCFNTD